MASQISRQRRAPSALVTWVKPKEAEELGDGGYIGELLQDDIGYFFSVAARELQHESIVNFVCFLADSTLSISVRNSHKLCKIRRVR